MPEINNVNGLQNNVSFKGNEQAQTQSPTSPIEQVENGDKLIMAGAVALAAASVASIAMAVKANGAKNDAQKALKTVQDTANELQKALSETQKAASEGQEAISSATTEGVNKIRQQANDSQRGFLNVVNVQTKNFEASRQGAESSLEEIVDEAEKYKEKAQSAAKQAQNAAQNAKSAQTGANNALSEMKSKMSKEALQKRLENARNGIELNWDERLRNCIPNSTEINQERLQQFKTIFSQEQQASLSDELIEFVLEGSSAPYDETCLKFLADNVALEELPKINSQGFNLFCQGIFKPQETQEVLKWCKIDTDSAQIQKLQEHISELNQERELARVNDIITQYAKKHYGKTAEFNETKFQQLLDNLSKNQMKGLDYETFGVLVGDSTTSKIPEETIELLKQFSPEELTKIQEAPGGRTTLKILAQGNLQGKELEEQKEFLFHLAGRQTDTKFA